MCTLGVSYKNVTPVVRELSFVIFCWDTVTLILCASTRVLTFTRDTISPLKPKRAYTKNARVERRRVLEKRNYTLHTVIRVKPNRRVAFCARKVPLKFRLFGPAAVVLVYTPRVPCLWTVRRAVATPPRRRRPKHFAVIHSSTRHVVTVTTSWANLNRYVN